VAMVPRNTNGQADVVIFKPFLNAGEWAHHRIQTEEYLISAPRSELKSVDTAADSCASSSLNQMKRDT